MEITINQLLEGKPTIIKVSEEDLEKYFER